MIQAETRLLLVRHPETEANVTGRYVGRGDSAFTERGLAQVESLTARIEEFQPAAIYASPLRRALVVAEAAASSLGVELTTDARLTELDFGVAEGLTYAELSAKGIRFDFESIEAPVAPEGESRAEIWRRSVAAIDEILAEGGRSAIVTHGGVFRSALPYLLGLSIDQIWTFHIRNAQVAEVTVMEGTGRLEEFLAL